MDSIHIVSNRRQAPRINLSIGLRYCVLRSNIPEQNAESLNLSARGIYFATDLKLKEGSVVQLVMNMPEEITGKAPTEWRCTGHVVRVSPIKSKYGSFGVGVRYDCYEILRPPVPPTHP